MISTNNASNQNIDLARIIKRLELIKSLISLEEEEEINSHVYKLEQQDLPIEIAIIIVYLKEKSFSKAAIAIDEFINKNHNIAIYNDPEINALKLEIKSLETEINKLSDEKADLEKLIHEFGVRHNQELGELIIQILMFRKERAEGTEQQDEAEEDYNNYHKEYESSKDEYIAEITAAEKKELKDIYRKASKLCHPDVVSEEQKELATILFADLSIAYEKNDLKKVQEILRDLENGHFFITKSDAIEEKQLLIREMKKLRLLIKELKVQMNVLIESDTFKTINSIDNWDEYFSNAKEKLRLQLNDMEKRKQ